MKDCFGAEIGIGDRVKFSTDHLRETDRSSFGIVVALDYEICWIWVKGQTDENKWSKYIDTVEKVS